MIQINLTNKKKPTVVFLSRIFSQQLPRDFSVFIPLALAAFLLIGLYSLQGLAGEDEAFEGSMTDTPAPFDFPTFNGNGTTDGVPAFGEVETTEAEPTVKPDLVQGAEPGSVTETDKPDAEPSVTPVLAFVTEYQGLEAQYQQLLKLIEPYDNLLIDTLSIKKLLQSSPSLAQAKAHEAKDKFESLASIELDLTFFSQKRTRIAAGLNEFKEKYKDQTSEEYQAILKNIALIEATMKGLDARPEAILNYVENELSMGFANIHPYNTAIIEKLNSPEYQANLGSASIEMIYHIGRFTRMALQELGRGTKTLVESFKATMISFYGAMSLPNDPNQNLSERLRSWLNCMLLIDGSTAQSCTPSVEINGQF